MNTPQDDEALLRISGLRVGFGSPKHRLTILDGLDLSLRKREILALVGESGSGKSMTALAAMRLLPQGAAVTAGEVRLGEQDLMALDDKAMNKVRGARIAMLYQQPKIMLDPTATVGSQVAEAMRLRWNLSRAEAWPKVIGLLRDVGIPEPELRAKSYSYQLSGGMAQRVMIAAALSAEPEVLIADEPTTALDVTVQAQILRLLRKKRDEHGLAILLITHDLAIVSSIADRVAVMYAGRVVEQGPARDILHAPSHPYTQALLRSSLMQAKEDGRLYAIPGHVAASHSMTCGCRFQPRCPLAGQLGIEARCLSDEPKLETVGAAHESRCWGQEREGGVHAV
jgi:peptide/nickel transport system ATP-binding protein